MAGTGAIMNETTDDLAFSRIQRLEAPSGASIAFRHQPSALATARGVLMICHGLVDHAGRYRRLADVMSKQGFEVYAHDHRGHGRTRAADAPLGRFGWKDGAEKVVADVMAMRRMAGERHPGLPVILTTGYSDEIATSGAGGLPVILKPYTPEMLATALAQALDRRSSQAQ